MLKVRNAEEALILAKEMCSRHSSLVKTVSSINAPRDVALKILLEELQLGEPTAKALQTNKAMTSAVAKTSVAATSASTSGADSSAKAPLTQLRSCPYCTEPTSRYCKETGRRHQTPEEKSLFMWKKIFRQFSLASQFVACARLAKKNTCVEQFDVELDF